jgi:hypothetical protein
MSAFRKVVFMAIASLGSLALPLVAQTSTPPAHLLSTNAAPMPPVLPPPPKSPVERFRELLVMAPVERARFLSDRSPETKKLILDKISEYLAMPVDQREKRLTVTELRWYLLRLMNLPEAERKAQMELIPGEMRKLVDDRLRVWHLLPPNMQKELLDNERAVRYLIDAASGYTSNSTPLLQTNLATYLALPQSEQQEIVRLFNHFFELSKSEQENVLHKMSGPETLQIEKALRTFQALPPVQRAQCIRSFGQFATLSPHERVQFLKDAQKWEQMSPADRENFRKLVEQTSLQPPMPTAPPLRPPPTSLRQRMPDTATNGN